MPENELTFTQEYFLCVRKGGELVMIEKQNGHIESYSVKPSTVGYRTKVFGCDIPDKPQK
jgi:hypothetical protein